MELDKTTKQLLRDPHKRKAWVIYQLQLRGTNQAQLAKRHKVGRTTLYQVWDRRYPRMQKIIADALDLAPQELFPERYDEDGLPLKHRGGAHCPCCSVNRVSRYPDADSDGNTQKVGAA